MMPTSSPRIPRLISWLINFSDVVSHLALSPATLQEYFLQCNEDPVMAVENGAKLECTDRQPADPRFIGGD